MLKLIVVSLLLATQSEARPQEGLTRSGGSGFRFPGRKESIVTYEGEGGGGGGTQPVATTGIKCAYPGRFVIAPDGCNRCFCEQNGELSPACSKALCPPGFPSTVARFNTQLQLQLQPQPQTSN